MTIDTYHKVVPRFNSYILVLVPKDLEAACGLSTSRRLGGAFRVEAGNEAVESAEHCRHSYVV